MSSQNLNFSYIFKGKISEFQKNITNKEKKGFDKYLFLNLEKKKKKLSNNLLELENY